MQLLYERQGWQAWPSKTLSRWQKKIFPFLRPRSASAKQRAPQTGRSDCATQGTEGDILATFTGIYPLDVHHAQTTTDNHQHLSTLIITQEDVSAKEPSAPQVQSNALRQLNVAIMRQKSYNKKSRFQNNPKKTPAPPYTYKPPINKRPKKQCPMKGSATMRAFRGRHMWTPKSLPNPCIPMTRQKHVVDVDRVKSLWRNVEQAMMSKCKQIASYDNFMPKHHSLPGPHSSQKDEYRDDTASGLFPLL